MSVINSLLTKLALGCTRRLSALSLYCTDQAHCRDLGPIFSHYSSPAWIIRYIIRTYGNLHGCILTRYWTSSLQYWIFGVGKYRITTQGFKQILGYFFFSDYEDEKTAWRIKFVGITWVVVEWRLRPAYLSSINHEDNFEHHLFFYL